MHNEILKINKNGSIFFIPNSTADTNGEITKFEGIEELGVVKKLVNDNLTS